MAAAPVRRELLVRREVTARAALTVRRVLTGRERVVVMKMAAVIESTVLALQTTATEVIAAMTVAGPVRVVVVVTVKKQFAFATVREDLVVPTVMGG